MRTIELLPGLFQIRMSEEKPAEVPAEVAADPEGAPAVRERQKQ